MPEINETLEMKTCDSGPAIILQGWGNSDSSEQPPDEYLRGQLGSHSNFVAHARKFEKLISITLDPAKLFKVEPAYRAKRVEQIKSALGQLILQRPLKIQVAYFSRLTDNVDILVPSLGEMYTMGIVHRCCEEDSIVQGPEIGSKLIRPELRSKLKKYSTVEVIR